jgi:hypothetical protein
LDKLSSGLALFFICDSSLFKANNVEFIRWMLVLVPSIGCGLSWLLVVVGKAKDYDTKSK